MSFDNNDAPLPLLTMTVPKHTLEEVLDFARELTSVAQRLFPGCEIWLFGSYAKGSAHPASDIDVGILVPEADLDRYSAEGSMWDRMCELWLASDQVDDMISTCVRGAGTDFAAHIRETGIEVA